MSKISFVVNIYVDTDTSVENNFDHPTVLKTFDTENTFYKTVKSINEVNIPSGYDVDLIVLANAVNNVGSYDDIIKEKVSKNLDGLKIDSLIITNSEVQSLNNKGFTFPATDGYCDLRNLGFIFSYYNNTDIVVQIDDDELVKPNHLIKMLEIFEENPHIKILSGLYMNRNGIYQDELKDYKEWGKDRAMNDDRKIVTSSDIPVEIMYGMGGNMMVKKEFFSQICYPQDIPRGEDFALLLAANLVNLNGNDMAGISPGNDDFRTYSAKDDDVIIIHEQPYSEKNNRLKYIKLNLIRFIKQKFMLEGYITKEKYWEISRYMYLMTMNENFIKQIEKIYNEAVERFTDDCPAGKAATDLIEVKDAYKAYSKRDLFQEYKEFQKSYIDLLNNSEININEYIVNS
ncbi:MAG TPA: hypothetical protein QF753_16595 [Victivallales bacterium]|nr:hypothetical protein [Victivallales bacterium]